MALEEKKVIKQNTVKQELKVLFKLALPVCLGQLAGLSMSFVDTVMAGRAGAEQMAAVAIASSFWVPVTLFGQGLMMSITPLVAQTFSGDKKDVVARYLRQGLWLSLMVAAVLIAVLLGLNLFLRTLTNIDPVMQKVAVNYLLIMVLGVPPLMLYCAQRCFLEGLAQTRPTMIIGFVGLFVNIPMNYIFIFGKFGMPALGAVGCAVATVAVCFSMCFAIHFFVKKANPQAFKFEKPDFKIIKRIFFIAFPNAVALLIETSVFAIVALVIAPLGTNIVAAHQIALNVSGMFFMIPLSLSTVASIRVGSNLGQFNREGVRTVRRAILYMALCVGLFNAIIMFTFRGPIATLYTSDTVVVPLAMYFLFFAAIFQLVDSLQVSFMGVLRGYNDTKAVLAICFFSYWCLGFPTGYVLAMTSIITPEPLGAPGFWIGIVIGLMLAALLFISRSLFLEKQTDAKIEKRISG